MVTERFNIFLVRLDLTAGGETAKTRPCVVVSPDELNRAVATVIIAPMTTTRRGWPTRVEITFQGKTGEMAEKIAVGKLNKFFKENTLLPQAFVKDPSKSVAEYLKSVDNGLTVTAFIRVAVGS